LSVLSISTFAPSVTRRTPLLSLFPLTHAFRVHVCWRHSLARVFVVLCAGAFDQMGRVFRGVLLDFLDDRIGQIYVALVSKPHQVKEDIRHFLAKMLAVCKSK
jgi:hypothetical protein